MVVEQLAKAGFVAPTGTTRQGHRPERTVYALTDAGRAELDEWMRSIVEEPRHEYPDFVAALSLIGALRPADVVRLLARRLERLAELQEEARRVRDDALAAGVHALFVVEEDYRLALLEAEAAFCRGFVARINDSRNGWRADWEEFHRAATARDNGKDDG
jgi:DNA-binding PadR family transcriptional regulator